MDWARAVDINRTALTRIVAEMFALLGLVAGQSIERLPRSVYLAVERLLRPTEAALRRLIVIAARGVILKPSAKRPMPIGLEFKRDQSKPLAFSLFDKRPHFEFVATENPLFIKVETTSHNPFNLFERRYYMQQPEQQDDLINATHLHRRLAAVAHALQSLPRQAKRLARWTARRAAMKGSKFTSPLRPGPPPGYQAKPKAEIDFVLRECHALAWDTLSLDSS